ncbi:matrixin family metalloprotease [Clostridium algidicarnis]|uniref:matrixin family metalloprotease n=1 Tax=Clostridium algidicarnis TaxID=37659 RepID=UPI001629961D|nr:matrixin family metalloprotease [Clostridium algidicarnis]
MITYSTDSKAYVFNNQNVGYNPQYINLSSGNPYLSHLNCATKWSYQGGKVFIKEFDYGGFVNIYQGFVDTDNGTYGVCYYNTNRQSDIRYYRAFKNASSAVRNETVVHEVGHAIGLSHTQSVNNTESVMRATGFNNKAYPLSDDKAGINAKY